MGMFEDLQRQYIDARKSGDKFASKVLNLVISDLKYEKINKQKDLEDADVIAYLRKTIKSRKEMLAECEQAKREDLAEETKAEIAFLEKLLPQMMSREELIALVKETKTAIGASSPSDMGKMMKEVMARVAGRAEGQEIKEIVTAVLKGEL
ncbi:GatB/YqeY domain-containing protein [Thermospira aquatica]|uniref:GatB/YqeY domain-containing protein n=1 Tax=Thermospira aquatica TaxID=2828656 RepID=A0AAX3BFQ9_9SPIR|nr:GatB/YqeY domain-containing protein [Thermospira aquatica]URA11081.1 GatB/YqeY domain-containing protein [Thermospira aquatica]